MGCLTKQREKSGYYRVWGRVKCRWNLKAGFWEAWSKTGLWVEGLTCAGPETTKSNKHGPLGSESPYLTLCIWVGHQSSFSVPKWLSSRRSKKTISIAPSSFQTAKSLSIHDFWEQCPSEYESNGCSGKGGPLWHLTVGGCPQKSVSWYLCP